MVALGYGGPWLWRAVTVIPNTSLIAAPYLLYWTLSVSLWN